MRMVVVKARPVGKHEVAFHLVKRKRPMRIELGELVLFLVLRQSGHAESSGIFVRIFSGIIPPAFERPHQVRTDELHRLDDGIKVIPVMPRDAVLSFDAK